MSNPFQTIEKAKTVLVYAGNGFGPVSNWEIAAMYVTPAKAMEIQSRYVLEGKKVKVVPYEALDEVLGMLA